MSMTRVAKVERLRMRLEDGGRTLRYFVRPGSRRRPWIWLKLDEVPPFDGDFAWFELERRKDGWRAVRQVERLD